ncbi:hypothetical protein BH24ACT4_BH24ACT4_07830 [soil metagenome]
MMNGAPISPAPPESIEIGSRRRLILRWGVPRVYRATVAA